ncbi:MAG: bifunctional riboflavin kinase/FAD synthetase [Bacillota bacterium]|nr:bifunctional riboflavin kinase/FAD synthetase [Bacillota bacterium]
MKVVADGEKIGSSFVCIGNFDGVHLAHKALIEEAINSKGDNPSVVYTFKPHPAVVMGQSLGLLMSDKQKEDCIKELGVDILYLQPTTSEYLSMSPEGFAKDILKDKIGAIKVFVGYDFRFGAKGVGDAEALKKFGIKYGFEVKIMPEIKVDGETVKSSLIRDYINKGNFYKANKFLGRLFTYRGKVSHGKKLGRVLGYPTANIFPEKGMVIPPLGVYASKLKIDDLWYDGVSNIGVNPTVEDTGRIKIESNIFNFNNEIYGKTIEVALIEYIRDEIKFKNKEELIKQIDKDFICAKKIFDKD